MLDTIAGYAREWWWLVPLSALLFVASIVAVFAIVVRMPADYFRGAQRPMAPSRRMHPLARIALRAAKQLFGCALIAVGLVMLLTPGQGLLTILIGVTLLDFRGKYALERRLVRQPPVLRGVNWLRARAGRGPLVL